MPTVIDELVTILGLDMKPGTAALVASFNNSLDKVTKFAGWTGAALIGAASSVGYFIKRTSEAAAQIDKFKDLTGISTDRLQGWQYAVERVGGSAEALQQDLMSLTKSMSSPIPGEYNSALFMLGINLKKASGEAKSADEILLDIADKFQGMSKIKQIQWASHIGISDDTLLLLQQGRKAIEEFQGQAAAIPTIVDPKALKQAREFTIQMTMLGRVFTYVQQTATSAAGPIMKELVNTVSEFLKMNKQLIQTGLRDFILGVVEGFRRFWSDTKQLKDKIFELLPFLKDFKTRLSDVIKEMGGAEVVARGVWIILGALATVFALIAGKWILIATALVGVGLAIDDIVTYLKGGESATGMLIGKTKSAYEEFKRDYPAMTALVEGLALATKKGAEWAAKDIGNTFDWLSKQEKRKYKNTFEHVIDVTMPGGYGLDFLKSFEQLLEWNNSFAVKMQETWDGFKTRFQSIWTTSAEAAKNTWRGLSTAIVEIWKKLPGALSSIWKGLGSVLSKSWDGVKKVSQDIWDSIVLIVEKSIDKILLFVDSIKDKVKEVFADTLSKLNPLNWLGFMFPEGGEQSEGEGKGISEKAAALMEYFRQLPIVQEISQTLQVPQKPEKVFAPQVEQSRISQQYNNQKTAQVTNNWNVSQNFTGNNAPAVAEETVRKMKGSFINMTPGGLSPVTQ